MLYHPWRGIRALTDWRVIARDLGPNVMGYTHRASRTIVIHAGLDQRERRCTIAHELEHVAAGHNGCQPAKVEREVSLRCARRLLPVAHVIRGLQWTRHLVEFAEYTWVDLDTASRRLHNLSRDERRTIQAALDRNEKIA